MNNRILHKSEEETIVFCQTADLGSSTGMEASMQRAYCSLLFAFNSGIARNCEKFKHWEMYENLETNWTEESPKGRK